MTTFIRHAAVHWQGAIQTKSRIVTLVLAAVVVFCALQAAKMEGHLVDRSCRDLPCRRTEAGDDPLFCVYQSTWVVQPKPVYGIPTFSAATRYDMSHPVACLSARRSSKYTQ